MEMGLPVLSRIFNPLLKDILCLLYKLPVEVNCIVCNPPRRIILAKYEIGRLLIVLIHFRSVRLALLRQLMRLTSIAALICLMCLFVPVRMRARRLQRMLSRTRSKQELLFPASCRARSRRRSYSFSESLLGPWLKAVGHDIVSLFSRMVMAWV